MEEQASVKKYARTQILLDSGEYTLGRLNLATGEIKPYKYPEAKPKIKPRGKLDCEDCTDPPWVTVPPPERVVRSSGTRNMQKTKSNPNKIYLEDFMTYSDAIEYFPMLDDIMVGAVNLGDRGKNLMSKGALFTMLRDMDEINVETIKARTGHSEKHCYRLAQHLRILSNAFDMEVDR